MQIIKVFITTLTVLMFSSTGFAEQINLSSYDEVIPSGTYRLLQATGKFSRECPNEQDPLIWRALDNNTLQLQINPRLAVGGQVSMFRINNANSITIRTSETQKYILQKLKKNSYQILRYTNSEEDINCKIGLKEILED